MPETNSGLTRASDAPQDEGYANPVTLVFPKREFTMRQVTDGELETIASLSNSVDLGFFMGSAGSFVTLLVTIFTVAFTNPVTFAGFVSALIVLGISTLFFGARARISHKRAEKKLDRILRGNG